MKGEPKYLDQAASVWHVWRFNRRTNDTGCVNCGRGYRPGAREPCPKALTCREIHQAARIREEVERFDYRGFLR